MVLTDAVYLKAPWLTPFDDGETAAAPFTRSDGSAVTVPMMHWAGQLAYAAGNGWQSVDLPYGGYELTMTVVVPDAGRLAEVEAQVSPDLLDTIVGTQGLRDVAARPAPVGRRVRLQPRRCPGCGRHAVARSTLRPRTSAR